MEFNNRLNPHGEQIKSFFGEGEDGPFVMINLLKFHDRAQYEDGDRGLSGAEAYAQYGQRVLRLVEERGGRPLYDGSVTGLLVGEVEENWDRVALVEYPTLAAFSDMLASPEYQEAAVHRTAGLAGQLNIKTKPSAR